MILNRILPASFQFSQSNQQDFIDCPRRFQLRYIWELAWPALQSEPALENERFLQQGAAFHHLVHQHLLGVPEERLSALIDAFVANNNRGELDLARWWENYLTWTGWGEGSTLYPEISLSASQDKYRLVAKYDLVLVSDQGNLTIVDWKTSRKRPVSQWLKERMQSRVYPYLLVSAGNRLIHGGNVQPEMVEMIYWFADFPQQPERFDYNSARFIEDKTYLSELVGEISSLGPDDFPLTSRIERCAFCVYRSFCNRGTQAGSLEEIEDSLEADVSADIILDFEQIGEIEF